MSADAFMGVAVAVALAILAGLTGAWVRFHWRSWRLQVACVSVLSAIFLACLIWNTAIQHASIEAARPLTGTAAEQIRSSVDKLAVSGPTLLLLFVCVVYLSLMPKIVDDMRAASPEGVGQSDESAG